MNSWWRRLAAYARPETGGIASLVLLTLLVAPLEALKPWPMKFVVDSVLGGQPLPARAGWIGGLPGADSPKGLLLWLAAGTVVLVVLIAGCRAVVSYVQAGVANRMVYHLGADLFLHMQKLSLRFHGTRPTGDLVRRVTADSRCVRELAINVMIPILTSAANLGAMLLFMWKLDPYLCTLALAIAPLLLAGIRLFGRSMDQRMFDHVEAQGGVAAVAERTLRSLPAIRTFQREADEDRRFAEAWLRSDRAHLRSTAAQLRFKAAADSVTALGTAAILGLGGLLVLQGELTVGSLLVFLSYLGALYAPMETLAYAAQGRAAALAGARRVFQILDSQPELQDDPGAPPLPPRSGRSGHVRLEDVTFGYEPRRPVLRGIDIEARPGDLVALVGASGAGKSTLASLIPRFADPWDGRVLVDGMDVRRVRLASLRSQIALVLQEPFLLPLSVAENIAYGRPEARPAEIRAAAVAAEADEFIRALPEGYDTVLGERGATLSGGERQRLAFARALLKDAPVLILDEPTSSLDAHTEAGVLRSMERLMKWRTTFLIAHRLATVRKADRIIVLQDGAIAEQGTHKELLARGGLYAGYHNKQFSGRLAVSKGSNKLE